MFLEHEKKVNVISYNKSHGTLAKDLSTVSGVLAYDDPITASTIILIVHQTIHVPTMDNNLFCPMLIWMNDVKLDYTHPSF